VHASTCRNCLTQRAKTSGAQFVPQNAATQIGKFIQIVNRFHAEHNLKLSEIWAADETGIQPYSTPNNTVNQRGVRSVCDCERCTFGKLRCASPAPETRRRATVLCCAHRQPARSCRRLWYSRARDISPKSRTKIDDI
jgi:hypothetical protein